MAAETHAQLANFIWSVCDLLRGPYKHNEYRKVILPLTVLRLFDCLLAHFFGERDPAAEICWLKPGVAEVDADLRDTESVPLTEDIHDYFKREVQPHVPDAWIDESKTKIGFEIPLNRHFYRYEPPRPLEIIEAEIKTLEEEIKALLGEVTL